MKTGDAAAMSYDDEEENAASFDDGAGNDAGDAGSAADENDERESDEMNETFFFAPAGFGDG